MSTQDLVNMAFAVIGSLVLWIMKGQRDVIISIQETIKENERSLQEKIKEGERRITAAEILIAGQYIKREEFERFITAVFKKLDKIEDKVDKRKIEE